MVNTVFPTKVLLLWDLWDFGDDEDKCFVAWICYKGDSPTGLAAGCIGLVYFSNVYLT